MLVRFAFVATGATQVLPVLLFTVAWINDRFVRRRCNNTHWMVFKECNHEIGGTFEAKTDDHLFQSLSELQSSDSESLDDKPTLNFR